MPDNTLLTIENAINNLDKLKFLNEKRPEAFYCSLFSQPGIIIVTNLRLSFFCIDREDNFKFDHLVFSLIQKIQFDYKDCKPLIEINYAYTKQTFIFNSIYDLISLKKILVNYIPEKLLIDEEFFVQLQKNESEVENIGETRVKSASELLIERHTRQLKLTWRRNLKNKLKKVMKNLLKIIIVLYLFSAIYPYLNNIKQFFWRKASYITNFIELQRCETEMLLIGNAINEYAAFHKIYPNDLSVFIRTSFKGRFTKDTARDPWNNLYIYREEKNNFSIISPGPDKKPDTYDDFIKDFTKINMTTE